MTRSGTQRRRTRLAGGLVVLLGLGLWAAPGAFADGPTTFSSTTAVAIPAVGSANQMGPAAPYPSGVTISGLAGTVSVVTVTFTGLTHSAVNDIDAMLVAPSGENLVLLSDVGDPATLAFASNATLTFSDAAAGSVPTGNIPTGTYRPTNNGAGDTFPAPAPSPSALTTLGGAFAGIDPNGTWQLYVVDDTSGDVGTMAGGWSLTLTTVAAEAATATTVTSSVDPSADGQPVTFTATVTSGGGPVSSGTVTFSADAVTLGAAVPVDASGTATFTTSALAPGTHTVLAQYGGDPQHLPSSGSLDQVVVGVVADAGGPYAVVEGGSLSLDGSGSTAGATYGWDLDGNGTFADATGVSPTLTWAQLEALGIDDGPSTHAVAVQVTVGATTVTSATAAVQVTNVAPTTVLTGGLTAVAGAPFTVKVGAVDPSSADLAATFTYTVDWGDGSAVLTVTGPADPPVTHTYASAGTYAASFAATDKDGGTGVPTTVQVVAAPAAPAPTPTPTPAPTASRPVGAQLSSSGADVQAPLSLALLLVMVGWAMLVTARRRRL
ncbi:MAG TPA: Ig-like domain repeat protein [Actinotalea sp.]